MKVRGPNYSRFCRLKIDLNNVAEISLYIGVILKCHKSFILLDLPKHIYLLVFEAEET